MEKGSYADDTELISVSALLLIIYSWKDIFLLANHCCLMCSRLGPLLQNSWITVSYFFLYSHRLIFKVEGSAQSGNYTQTYRLVNIQRELHTQSKVCLKQSGISGTSDSDLGFKHVFLMQYWLKQVGERWSWCRCLGCFYSRKIQQPLKCKLQAGDFNNLNEELRKSTESAAEPDSVLHFPHVNTGITFTPALCTSFFFPFPPWAAPWFVSDLKKKACDVTLHVFIVLKAISLLETVCINVLFEEKAKITCFTRSNGYYTFMFVNA